MLETPTDLSGDAVVEISGALRQLLADVFALYMKTKNFHWHMTGAHFRDYHLLLDEQSTQIFAMTDDIAERARKIGAQTLHSISDISSHQRLKDNNTTSSLLKICCTSCVATTWSSPAISAPRVSSAKGITTSPLPA